MTSEYGFDEVGPAGKTVCFTIDDAVREQSEDELLEAWADADWDLAEPPGGAVEEKGAQPPEAVRLLGLPPTLWLAARQHHDALLRELVLYLTEHGGLDVDVPTAGPSPDGASAP